MLEERHEPLTLWLTAMSPRRKKRILAHQKNTIINHSSTSGKHTHPYKSNVPQNVQREQGQIKIDDPQMIVIREAIE